MPQVSQGRPGRQPQARTPVSGRLARRSICHTAAPCRVACFTRLPLPSRDGVPQSTPPVCILELCGIKCMANRWRKTTAFFPFPKQHRRVRLPTDNGNTTSSRKRKCVCVGGGIEGEGAWGGRGQPSHTS